MKHFHGLLTFVCLCVVAAAATADESKAVEANRALAKAFETAWNTHDMDPGLRRLVTSNVDWVNVDGGWGSGIEQIVSGHASVHRTKFKDSVFTVAQVQVSIVRPDVAVVHVKWNIRGDLNNDGSAREPRDGIFTWLTVNDDGTWKIRSSHNSNKQVVR